jgi:hypothetical protein
MRKNLFFNKLSYYCEAELYKEKYNKGGDIFAGLAELRVKPQYYIFIIMVI